MSYKLIITGATKGIGKSIAEAFAAEGFSIVFCSRSETDVAATEAFLMNNFHIQCKGFVCDASNKKEIQDFADKAIAFLGGCDVLVNNAGVFIPGSIEEEADGVFEQQMAVNISSAYYLSQKLIPILKHGSRAHIFNMCSIASIKGYANGGSYCISKHAMLGLTRVLREELKPAGIAVSAIMPGATLTESWGDSELPASRFMRTSDVGKAITMAWHINEHTVMEEVILRPIAGDI